MSTTNLQIQTKASLRGIFPTWAYQPAELAGAAKRKTRRAGEWSLFHTVRLPRYWGRASRHMLPGAALCTAEFAKWIVDTDGRHVKKSTARGDSDAQSNYIEVRQTHGRDMRNRLLVSASSVPLAYVLAPHLWESLSSISQHGIIAGVIGTVPPVLGLIGKPLDSSITDQVAYSPRALELSQSVIVSALSRGVHPALTAAIKEDPNCVVFTSEVARDGKIKGWVAHFRLPVGVIAKNVIDKADVFIGNMAGVKRSQVELTTDDDPALVHLVVTDKPLSEMPVPIWPHLGAESLDVFAPFSIAFTAHHEDVTMNMHGTSILVGGSPNSGKSQTDSLVIASHVLDPVADIDAIFQFKGTGDFGVFTDVALRNVCGTSDTVLAGAIDYLRSLCDSRALREELIRESALCPNHSLTRDAALEDERLRPKLVVFDEIQVLLRHPDFGPKAIPLLAELAELGRASGIRLLISTQTPNAETLPSIIANSMTTRIAHRLMSHEIVDRVLTSGSYKDGWRPNEFPRSTPGLAVIEGEEKIKARVYYLSPDDLSSIVARGVELRGGVVEKAPLEPVALPVAETVVEVDCGFALDTNLQFLVDVNTVIEGERKTIQIQQIFERLLESFGPRYERTDSAGIETMLRANGIRISAQVHKKNTVVDGVIKPTTRKGIYVQEFRNIVKGI